MYYVGADLGMGISDFGFTTCLNRAVGEFAVPILHIDPHLPAKV